MPKPIPESQHETPLRRQITSVGVSVALDTGTPELPLPQLSAQVGFTDLFTRGDGSVVSYPVSGTITLTHEELLAIPNSLGVIAAIQEMAYRKAIAEGI